MYSVILAVAMSTAPVTPDGLIFHRKSAGCTGTQAQAQSFSVVPVQSFAVVPMQASGCTGSFAAAPAATATGCSGGVAGRHYLLPHRGARVADRANRRNGVTSYAVAAPAAQLAMVPMQAVPVQTVVPAVTPEVKPAPGQTTTPPKKQIKAKTVYRTVPVSAYSMGYAVPCPSCPGGVRWIR